MSSVRYPVHWWPYEDQSDSRSCLELVNATTQNSFILTVPRHEHVQVVLSIGSDYPDVRPIVISAHGVAKSLAEELLERQPAGEVCLYGFIEDLIEVLDEESQKVQELQQELQFEPDQYQHAENSWTVQETIEAEGNEPEWTLSEPIIDRKSVFVGRACRVHTTDNVRSALQHMYLDKKIQKVWRTILKAKPKS